MGVADRPEHRKEKSPPTASPQPLGSYEPASRLAGSAGSVGDEEWKGASSMFLDEIRPLTSDDVAVPCMRTGLRVEPSPISNGAVRSSNDDPPNLTAQCKQPGKICQGEIGKKHKIFGASCLSCLSLVVMFPAGAIGKNPEARAQKP